MEYCIVLAALIIPGSYLAWRITRSARTDCGGCGDGCRQCSRCRDC